MRHQPKNLPEALSAAWTVLLLQNKPCGRLGKCQNYRISAVEGLERAYSVELVLWKT